MTKALRTAKSSIGFDVELNGIKRCVAGVKGDGVLTTIVTSVTGRGKTSVHLDVSGFVTETGGHVTWQRRALRVGDVLRIEVVDVNDIDEPEKVKPKDPAEELRAKKRYVRQMAKELGWTVRTHA